MSCKKQRNISSLRWGDTSSGRDTQVPPILHMENRSSVSPMTREWRCESGLCIDRSSVSKPRTQSSCLHKRWGLLCEKSMLVYEVQGMASWVVPLQFMHLPYNYGAAKQTGWVLLRFVKCLQWQMRVLKRPCLRTWQMCALGFPLCWRSQDAG